MKNVWYKVHKNTKEHEILCEEAVSAISKGFCVSLYGYDLVKADADGWIEWKGGECPLKKGALCEIKFKDGDICSCTHPESPRWEHEGSDGDIIDYRPILNNKEERVKEE